MTDAAKFAQENGKVVLILDCLFTEASALTGESVEHAFNKLLETLVYKVD